MMARRYLLEKPLFLLKLMVKLFQNELAFISKKNIFRIIPTISITISTVAFFFASQPNSSSPSSSSSLTSSSSSGAASQTRNVHQQHQQTKSSTSAVRSVSSVSSTISSSGAAGKIQSVLSTVSSVWLSSHSAGQDSETQDCLHQSTTSGAGETVQAEQVPLQTQEIRGGHQSLS